MTRPRQTQTRLLFLWIIAAASVLTLAAAVVLNWMSANSIAEFRAEPATPTARVTAVDYVASTPVTLRASVEKVELLYRGQGGVVTEVRVTTEAPLKSGSALLHVDGTAVIGWAGAATFFRDLAVDAQGEDVRELQNYLASAGYLDGSSDGKFGSATRSAVKKLQAAIGAPDSDGVFRVGYIARLPAEALIPTIVQVRQDARIEQGDVIAEIEGVGPDFEIQAAESVPAGDYTITVSGATIPAMFDGTLWTVQLPDDLDLIALAKTEDSADAIEIQASARQTQGTSALSIPPAALITTEDGATCIARVEGSGESELVKITILGTDVSGAVLVAPGEGLAAGDSVGLRPEPRACK